jgi:hypothetical protein
MAETVTYNYFSASANAAEKHRECRALRRRARFTAAVARVCTLLTGLLLAMMLLMAMSSFGFFRQHRDYLDLDPAPSAGRLAERAQRVKALREEGRAIFWITMALVLVGSTALTVLFARRWARAASESVAQSEGQNRELLLASRAAGVPIALFLRGFQEESRSFDTLSAMPLSTSRVDKATRWIEAEVMDELKRRDINVFCIANPSDTFLLPGAFRLEVKGKDWLSEVHDLARVSEVIVIYVSALSEGLRTELELLRSQNLTGKTIAILTRKIVDRSSAASFPTAIIAPSSSIGNRSAFGPLFGRSRFRREFRAGLEQVISA